jgi:transposase
MKAIECGPENCPITAWVALSPNERKLQRQSLARKMYEQGFTMEAIATQFGVSVMTIQRDLESFNTMLKPSRPKGGRPKNNGKTKRPRKNERAVENSAANLVLDGGTSLEQAAKQPGFNGSVQVVKMAVAREEGRREATEELLDAAATEKFSKSGVLRIEDAIRIHKDRLNKAFEQEVDKEVRKRIAAADDATREQNKKLRHENLQLRQMLNKRGVFSEMQFNNLLKCIHPDNTASTTVRNELLPFLINNKQRLVTDMH